MAEASRRSRVGVAMREPEAEGARGMRESRVEREESRVREVEVDRRAVEVSRGVVLVVLVLVLVVEESREGREVEGALRSRPEAEESADARVGVAGALREAEGALEVRVVDESLLVDDVRVIEGEREGARDVRPVEEGFAVLDVEDALGMEDSRVGVGGASLVRDREATLGRGRVTEELRLPEVRTALFSREADPAAPGRERPRSIALA